MAEQEQEVVLEPGGIEVDISADPSNKPQESKVSAGDPPERQPEPPRPEPTVGVEALQRQIKSLEQREAAALRERQHQESLAREKASELALAQEEIARVKGEAVDTRRASLDSSIIASQAEADIARRDYQLAMEQGDFAKVSEANLRLNKAAAQVALLEDKKANFAEAARVRAHEGTVRQPQERQPQRPVDEVEAYIVNKSPRTQAWLREHAECITDPRMNNKTVSAHYAALAEGFSPDTESYFDFIDRNLGFAGDAGFVEPEPVAEQPRRAAPRAAPPAAPVSRDPARNDRSGNRIYLSRSEQETAEALGMSHAQYAKNKVAMEKLGYYHS